MWLETNGRNHVGVCKKVSGGCNDHPVAVLVDKGIIELNLSMLQSF